MKVRSTFAAGACAVETFVANFRPMKLSRNWLCFLCVLLLSSVPSVWSQDATDSEAVRPSGVSGSVRKAKAVTAKADEDTDAESTPTRKAKTSKSTITEAALVFGIPSGVYSVGAGIVSGVS